MRIKQTPAKNKAKFGFDQSGLCTHYVKFKQTPAKIKQNVSKRIKWLDWQILLGIEISGFWSGPLVENINFANNRMKKVTGVLVLLEYF